MESFRPAPGGTVSRTVTTTSANIQRPAAARGCNAVRIVFTAGLQGARVRFGQGSSLEATSADMLLQNPGAPFNYAESFSLDDKDDYIAAITDAGTCTIEITFGYGI